MGLCVLVWYGGERENWVYTILWSKQSLHFCGIEEEAGEVRLMYMDG